MRTNIWLAMMKIYEDEEDEEDEEGYGYYCYYVDKKRARKMEATQGQEKHRKLHSTTPRTSTTWEQ